MIHLTERIQALASDVVIITNLLILTMKLWGMFQATRAGHRLIVTFSDQSNSIEISLYNRSMCIYQCGE